MENTKKPLRGSNHIRLKSTSNLAAAVLLVLVLAVVITLLSGRHYIRWDLTSTGEHTLSDKTLQVLKTIREPVEIKAFVQDGYAGIEETKGLLEAYHYQAPRISYELVDPDRNPAVTRRYNVRALNTLIIEGYKSSQTVKTPDEENITNALIRLSKSEKQMLYWLTGHGERPFRGSEPESLTILQEGLSKENLTFQEMNLMQGVIPEDASLVVVAAPEKPLFPVEVESLREYLNRGGSVVVFLEPFRDAGLRDFLKGYGILISEDIIVDKMSRVMGGDYLLPMAADYGSHEITRGFRHTCIFSIARSVEVDQAANKGVSLTNLAFTSPDSWAETDRRALDEGTVALEEQDRKGPISLGVIAELRPSRKTAKEEGENQPVKITGGGKMVVFGDCDFASDKHFNLSGNGDLITNAVNYLVGRKDLITINERHKPIEALTLTRNQGLVLFWIPVVVIPLVTLIIGVLIWNRRRSR
jgi:ABC-type uncharacterized transport system involved in gliding motility auxiliary subunit